MIWRSLVSGMSLIVSDSVPEQHPDKARRKEMNTLTYYFYSLFCIWHQVRRFSREILHTGPLTRYENNMIKTVLLVSLMINDICICIIAV